MLSAGCAAPNAVPAAAEATEAPESTPVQEPVPEESKEVQQVKEIAFADESHGYEYAEEMDLEALLKEKDVFVETYAYDEWSPKTIMISYENAGELAASQSILFFAQNIERSKLDPDFSENEYESLGITTEELSGNEYVCVNLKNVTENRLEKFFLRKHGNWIIRVEIYAENASVMKTLQGWFSEPE